MKRREFLKGAAIAPAAVAASQWAHARELLGNPNSRITAVVYDERYADCRIFAERLARQGAALFATGGDAVRVWYGPLRAHLAQGGGSVAGMTTDSDWGASRACGRELGLRTAYEGSHDCRVSHRMIHRLRGSGEEREVYAALLRDERPWSEAVAEALSHPRLTERMLSAVAGGGDVTTAKSAGHPGYLTSWLLALGALNPAP